MNKKGWQEGLNLVQELNEALVADCRLHLENNAAAAAEHSHPEYDVEMVDD